LVFTLPPQHQGEETADWTWWGPTWQSLGGDVPPGAPVSMMSTSAERLDVFFACDDGIVRSQHWRPDFGWLTVTHGGATFVPGSSLVSVGLDDVHVYGVDDAQRLCRLIWQWDIGPTDWVPVDVGATEVPFFEPGTQVSVAFVQDETQVFLVHGGQLIHWSASGGARVVRQLASGARVWSVGIANSLAVVVSVFDDGRLVFDWWDGNQWLSQVFDEPPASAAVPAPPRLDPWTVLEVTAPAKTGVVYVYTVRDDGSLWVFRAFTGPSAPVAFWDHARWFRLGDGFLPRAALATTRGNFVDGAFKPPLLTVRDDGALIATRMIEPLTVPTAETWVTLGDWYPPGGRIALVPFGGEHTAAVVASDRTVRQASTTNGHWPSTPAGWEAAEHIFIRRARLSGPSQLGVRLPRGERVTLTTAGVLGALARHPLRAWPDPGPVTGDQTLLELPWGLFVSPPHDGETATSHSLVPVVSQRGTVGLWHSRLVPAGAPTRDVSTSRLRAVRERRDEEGGENFGPPLPEAQRRLILAEGRTKPFAAEAALSSLGGWLSADGDWSLIDWEHRAVGGRDVTVRTVERGVLFPLGHAATYEESSTRRFDPRSGRSTAIIHRQGVLTCTRPLLVDDERDDAEFRAFPFTEAELAERALKDLDPPQRHFVGASPEAGSFFRVRRNGVDVEVPVWLRRDGNEALARLPVLFVSAAAVASTDATVLQARLAELYAQTNPADLAGAPVRLAGDQLFETHTLRLQADVRSAGTADAPFDRPFVTRIQQAAIGLPAVRQLTQHARAYEVAFTDAYREFGHTDVLLRTVGNRVTDRIGVHFPTSDLAGGLATPSFVADAISGAGEPIKEALAGLEQFDPGQLFSEEAKLLGLVPLRDVIAVVHGGKPPSLTSLPGSPSSIELVWDEARCEEAGPFRPIEGATAALSLSVKATVDPATMHPTVRTHGRLTNFCLDLAGVLVVQFREVTFTMVGDEKPALQVRGLDVRLAGDLEFLAVLQDAAAQLVPDVPVRVEATPRGISVSHQIAVPPLTFSAGTVSVSVRELLFRTRLSLPFDGEVAVELGFASRRHPFLLGVWLLGGGGYLELQIRGGEVTEMSCAVELGGVFAVDWVVVRGEVHALAGIDIRLRPDHGAVLTGYLRVGGSVEVLGLISVSIEVSAAIIATQDPFRVVAEARIVLEVDLFLVSTGVELHETIEIYEAGQGLLDVGGPLTVDALAPRRLDPEVARAAWIAYRRAFEGVPA
jgi:hypothetical protein